MPNEQFAIPIALDLVATFVFALIAATIAVRRQYDYIGVVLIAIFGGVGGSLLRDGLFLQQVPFAVADNRYMGVILAACVAGTLVSRLRKGLQTALLVIDAFGLGAYAMVGTQASLNSGIPCIGAALVGLLNAVGGSVLRDIAIRDEPIIFKPSEHYAGTALAGIVVFLFLDWTASPRFIAGAAGIAVTFSLRLLSVWLGWRTRPMAINWLDRPAQSDGV